MLTQAHILYVGSVFKISIDYGGLLYTGMVGMGKRPLLIHTYRKPPQSTENLETNFVLIISSLNNLTERSLVENVFHLWGRESAIL